VRNGDGQVLHQETRNPIGMLVAQTDNTYDQDGNLLSTTDGDGNVTVFAYDGAGRKTSETQGYGTAQAATTTYVYDDDGNLIELTDAAGNHTYFSYDGGLKVSMTDPQGHTSYYSYDDDGPRRPPLRLRLRGRSPGQ
jgi:YD repeat-containing protein